MDLMELVATIRINLDEFDRGLNSASNKFKSFSDSVSKVGSGMKDLLSPAVDGFKAVEGVGQTAAGVIKKGLTGFAAAATVVGGFGTSAVKAGSEFDTAMSQVAATAGYSVEELRDKTSVASAEFERMRNTAIEMGSTTSFSAKQSAEGLNILRMAGLSADESISGIPHVLNLAAAGAISMADAASYTTGAVKGFGDTMDNAQYYTDLIAKGATLANTNVGQLGEAFSGVSATATAYGQKADGVTLSLLRLAEQQVVGTEATTALRRVYADLYTPTNKAKTALESLGVATYDENGKARDLNLVVDELSAAMSGMSDQQKNATASTIFTTWGLQAFNKMTVSSTEKVQEFKNGLADAFGSAAQQAGTQLDNLKGDITLFKSALEGLQIVINDSLNPSLREFAKFGGEAMNELRRGFQEGGVSGFMSELTGIVTEGVSMLAEKAPLFADVSVQFVTALGEGLLNAAPQILTATNEVIDVLISGFSDFLGNHSSEMVEVGKGIIEAIASGFKEAGSVISEYIGEFVPLIADAFLSYHEALFTVGIEILGAIGKGLVENKEEVGRMASETIANIVTAIGENAPAIIEGAVVLLDALVNGIIENLPLILAVGAEIIGAIIDGVSGSLPAMAVVAGAIILEIGKVVEVISSISGAFSSVSTLVQSGLNTIMGIGSKLMGGLQALWGLILAHPVAAAVAAIIAAIVLLWTNCEEFREFFIGLWDSLKEAVNAFAEWFQGAWEGVKEFFSGLWEGFKEIVSEFGEWLSEKIGEIVDWFKEKWDGIKEFFSEFWEGLKEVVGLFGEWLSEKMGEIVEWIKEKWDGISEFFSGVWQGIMDVFQGVAEFFGEVFNAAAEAVQVGWQAVVEFFSGVWDGIVTVFSVAAEVLGEFFSAAAEAVQTVWEAVGTFFQGVWDGIRAVFEPVAEVLSGFFQAALDAVQGIWEAATEFFSGVWDGIQDVFSDVADVLGGFFEAAWDVVQGVWEAAVEFFSGIADGIHEVFDAVTQFLGETFQAAWDAVQSAWDTAIEFFGDIWNNIKEKGSEAANAVRDALKEAWNAIKEAWNGATEFFSGIVKDIIGVFKDIGSKFKEIGKNIVTGLKNGVTAAWESFTRFMSEKIKGIINSVKEKLGIHSPSKVFAGIGENMALGLAQGWDDEYSGIRRQIERGMDFGAVNVGLNAVRPASGSYDAVGMGNDRQSPAGNTYVTINSPKAVDAITAAREWKKTTQRMAIGYV